MTKMDDDMLMAFVDGQLDDADRRAVEYAVSSNPELRKRLMVFELTREPVARVFDPILRQPERQDLLRLIRGEDKLKCSGRDETSVNPYAANFFRALRRVFVPTLNSPMVVALSLLILVGAAGGWFLSNRLYVERALPSGLVSYENNRLIAQGDLEHTLETVPSGSLTAPEDNIQKKVLVTPILTFRDLQKRFCREYEVLYHGVQSYGGVACRANDGSWQVLVHIEQSMRPTSEKKFRPAAGGKIQVLDNVINRIMGSNALDATDEINLIKNGWSAASSAQ